MIVETVWTIARVPAPSSLRLAKTSLGDRIARRELSRADPDEVAGAGNGFSK
jgi:hypothetical protein